MDALERELATGDVACVLMEPAMTNVGIVLPDPGYHEALRALTRQYGSLLVVDETHTLCAGPGGMTAAGGLEPDVVTLGKAIGGGIACGAFGMTAEMSDRITASVDAEDVDVGGVGGTLAGNALALAAMRATLEHVLTAEAFSHMATLAQRWADGVQREVDGAGLGWHVARLGGRAEYAFSPAPPARARTRRQPTTSSCRPTCTSLPWWTVCS